MNKRKIERWLELKAQNCIPYPIRTVLRGRTTFYDEDQDEEYHQLLHSEDGEYLWRDGVDLKVFSDQIGVTIEVIVCRDGKLEGNPQQVSQQYPGEKIILLLDTGARHYQAVFNTEKKVNTKKIFYNLSKYITKPAVVKESKVDELEKNMLEMIKQVEAMKEDYSKLKDEVGIVHVKNASLAEEYAKLNEKYEDLKVKSDSFETELKSQLKPAAPAPTSPVTPPAGEAQASPAPAVSGGDVVDMELGTQQSQQDQEEDQNDESRECEILNANKNSGYVRDSPQFEAKKMNESVKCLICALQFDSRANLDKHKVIYWKKVDLTNGTEGTMSEEPAQRGVPG